VHAINGIFPMKAHGSIYCNIVNISGGDEVVLLTESARRDCPL